MTDKNAELPQAKAGFLKHLMEECAGAKQKPDDGMYTRFSSFCDEDGNFNPARFGKDLTDNYHFITLQDNDTVYVYDAKKGIYEATGEVLVKKKMGQILDMELRQRYYPDVLFCVKTHTYRERPQSPTNKLAVQNGILNVENRSFEPFNPDEFIIVVLPCTYDPNADCPQIKHFLEEVIGTEQMPLIQEMVGYCLLQAMPIHKAIMLVGGGANGKSTLLTLIKIFLGPRNVSNASLQGICENRFAGAQLYGKLANICADLPDKALTKTGMFKMLTGNDAVTVEEKFKHPFTFTNHAKMIFSTNKVPETPDDTIAFFRRWIILACNNTFTGKKCDPNIIGKLTTPQELSGFLNYALDGLKRLIENGDFSDAASLEELRSLYIRKNNSAKAYIEEKLEYDTDTNATIIGSELYQKYVLFCEAEKLPSMPKRNFTINMQQHLPQAKQTMRRIDGKQTHVWANVRFGSSAAVTGVTPAPSYLSTNNESQENSICIRWPEVTAVTPLPEREQRTVNPPSKTPNCAICLKPIPSDHSDTTYYHSREVHLTCFLRVKDSETT